MKNEVEKPFTTKRGEKFLKYLRQISHEDLIHNFKELKEQYFADSRGLGINT